MTGVTRVGQRSFASDQRCPYQRDNADWAASSWRQRCAAPVLYSQPATSNGVVSGSCYRGVARVSNTSARDGVLGPQCLLIAGQALTLGKVLSRTCASSLTSKNSSSRLPP